MNDFMFTGVSVPRFPRQEMKRPGARRSGSIPDSPTKEGTPENKKPTVDRSAFFCYKEATVVLSYNDTIQGG